MDIIRWFDSLDKSSGNIAGGKGANLAELVKAGLPVPPGFVVTPQAFRTFLDYHHLSESITQRINQVDINNTADLQKTAESIQQQVRGLDIPPEITDSISQAYKQLGQEKRSPFVAVRSSAIAEDTPGTSFAGMNETFLNVRGDDELLMAIRRCYASLYGARVIFYRRERGIPEERMGIAVIVQNMVNSDAAGVMFTVHPATGDTSLVVIEGAFGLGDAVVSGSVNPDHFEVRKANREITTRAIAHKDFRDIRTNEGTTIRETLSSPLADQPCLSDDQVQRLAEFAVQIEQHYGSPQDIEWATEGDKIFIVQSRPVTATGHAKATAPSTGGTVLIRGLAASPGHATGTVHVLNSPEEAAQLQNGEILVTKMTSPDWVPIMKIAGAIVTDEGGMTSHAAIVSRELGIPCIVGTKNASHTLTSGQEVTVDAVSGTVYAGKHEVTPPQKATPGERPTAPVTTVTGTRLYVNLAQPEMADAIAKRDVDGVGLLRAEFIMQTVTGGTHPRLLMDDGRSDELRDKLAENLRIFAYAFHPRPVIYRSLDFRSNEYRGMRGGDKYEKQESNPMIGYRGCFRNVAEPDLFGIELAAIKLVREQGLPNLHLMIPFVRTASEFRDCKALIDQSGLTRERDFELWVMAEVPSILYHLPDYQAAGITGVSIGSNDLTQLMLGIDRDSDILAPLFDERDTAVLGAIHDIICRCQQLGITSSICGQAPSVYPQLCEQLVQWGITSISVNPDALEHTRQLIAAAEQRILLDAARSSNP
ncbi:MAG TPA: phosphoenolpyruvate synthase [Armatimonadota bacterium]|nr:phosphoenolpyruvate synthase [Armatimonadota bacterium]